MVNALKPNTQPFAFRCDRWVRLKGLLFFTHVTFRGTAPVAWHLSLIWWPLTYSRKRTRLLGGPLNFGGYSAKDTPPTLFGFNFFQSERKKNNACYVDALESKWDTRFLQAGKWIWRTVVNDILVIPTFMGRVSSLEEWDWEAELFSQPLTDFFAGSSDNDNDDNFPHML